MAAKEKKTAATSAGATTKAADEDNDAPDDQRGARRRRRSRDEMIAERAYRISQSGGVRERRRELAARRSRAADRVAARTRAGGRARRDPLERRRRAPFARVSRRTACCAPMRRVGSPPDCPRAARRGILRRDERLCCSRPVDQQYLLAGAADAGAVARRAHPARLLRDRVPGARALRRVALPPHRRPALPDARDALVEGDDHAVRGRRRDRHDPQLRVRPALAAVHGVVRERLRARLRVRGLLVLPRGDLHRDLRLRAGTGSRRAGTWRAASSS